MQTTPVNIVLEEEVKTALKQNRPVVALESTIIAHGMPYPENLSTAIELEQTVRENGAVPATCAVINGKCKVGLSTKELQQLANGDFLKLASRDLPYAVAKGLNGATTVSGSLVLAEMAGVGVFATGGIGGVHRGYEKVLDISADLPELARRPVAVISSGCKSILDIPNTLEILETLSIPVLGYKTSDFPAFYSESSDFEVPTRLDSIEEITSFLQTHWGFGMKSGVLIANPVPKEWSIPSSQIGEIINKALESAHKNGVKGKKITPFLLNEVVERTDGEALKTNRQLALNNARVAAQIAVALSEQDH